MCERKRKIKKKRNKKKKKGKEKKERGLESPTCERIPLSFYSFKER